MNSMSNPLDSLLNPRRAKVAGTPVDASPLIARLNAFLPKMKEANSRLHSTDSDKLESIPGPEEVKDAKVHKTSTTEDEELSVNMELFVDDSCGELVATDDKAWTDEKKKPLIEQVDDADSTQPSC